MLNDQINDVVSISSFPLKAMHILQRSYGNKQPNGDNDHIASKGGWDKTSSEAHSNLKTVGESRQSLTLSLICWRSSNGSMIGDQV